MTFFQTMIPKLIHILNDQTCTDADNLLQNLKQYGFCFVELTSELLQAREQCVNSLATLFQQGIDSTLSYNVNGPKNLGHKTDGHKHAFRWLSGKEQVTFFPEGTAKIFNNMSHQFDISLLALCKVLEPLVGPLDEV